MAGVLENRLQQPISDETSHRLPLLPVRFLHIRQGTARSKSLIRIGFRFVQDLQSRSTGA